MADFQEVVFPLDAGMDQAGPSVVPGRIEYLDLQNLHPRHGRLIPSFGFVPKEKISDDAILSIAQAYNASTSTTLLLAFTKDSVYLYEVVNDAFNSTPIYNAFNDSDDPYAWIPWFGDIYVTRLSDNYCKLTALGRTTVDSSWQTGSGNISGRYMITANNHVLIGNISEGVDRYPTRLRWSDLFDPEKFTVATDSEADFFDLEASDSEITGLSNLRGNILIYTRNSIWIGRYNEFPILFRFEPLYSGIGNVHHYSKVSLPHADYFIGADGIYQLDLGGLKEIGRPIWSWWKRLTGLLSPSTKIRGTFSSELKEIYWTAQDHFHGTLETIVYNYEEDKWSRKDAQKVIVQEPAIPFSQGKAPIDHWGESYGVIDSWTDKLIDGDWQVGAISPQEIAGTTDGEIYLSSDTFYSASGVGRQCVLETKDIFFDNFSTEQNIDEICVQFKQGGIAGPLDLKLEVGTRRSLRDDITWSEPLLMSEQLTSESTFKYTPRHPGVFTRFRLSWFYDWQYISELTAISFKVKKKLLDER